MSPPQHTRKNPAPYKYEIEMLRNGKFDPALMDRIIRENEKTGD